MNKSAFLMVMAFFTYSAYFMWQRLLNEGYSLLRVISLALVLIGIALLLFSKLRSFLRDIKRGIRK